VLKGETVDSVTKGIYLEPNAGYRVMQILETVVARRFGQKAKELTDSKPPRDQCDDSQYRSAYF